MSRKYQVQTGDTLTKIAQRFYGEATYFELIAAANQLADPNKLAVGSHFRSPICPATGMSYRRRRGTRSARPAPSWSRSRAMYPLARFPWVQSFYSADIDAGLPWWFAFHVATRVYVAGPVGHVTFSAGFIGLEQNEVGFTEPHICVNGYLEAAPTS